MVPLIVLVATAAAGRWTLTPDEIPVHIKTTINLTYIVGPEGLAQGDALRIDDPRFHGMRWSKWGFLSTDPDDCTPLSEPNTGASGALVDAWTDGAATLEISREINQPNLHARAATTVVILDGALEEGQQVNFVVGDTETNPTCGLQTSVRTMVQVSWPVAVRTGEQGTFEYHQSPPVFDFVTAGPTEHLLVSAPSQALVGEPVRILVAAMDVLGNPVPSYDGLVTLDGELHAFELSDQGVWETWVAFEEAGVHRLEALGTAGLRGISNPVAVGEASPEGSVYWGDLHTHHGHSYTDETGFVHDTNHEYARDVVGLQVGCESLKASPHELDWEALWPEFQTTCETHTDENYIAILGFEWMGNENSPGEEGHHNVYYDTCDGILAPNTTTGLQGDESLWVFMLEAEAETGARSISVPHAPAFTGFNWRERDDELRPLAEIYSEWGDSSEMNPQGSSVYDALALGHRLGVFASSDNHDGWLGNRWASKNTEGGLAAFVATDLSREGIFEAMEQHATYATTGHRPLLGFEVEDGASIPMGQEYVASTPTVKWSYSADGGFIDEVELLSVLVDGGTEVEVLARWNPSDEDASGEIAVAWDGQDRALWLHIEESSREETWSSPIWLSTQCDGSVWDPAGHCNPLDTDEPDTAIEDTATESTDKKDSSCGACSSGGRAPGGLPLLGLVLSWGLRRHRPHAKDRT